MNLVIFIVVYLVCSTIGLMLLKMSVFGVELNSLQSYVKLLFNYKFIVGFLFYATSFFVWMILLGKKDLSYIFPMVIGLSYLSIMALAIFVFKENFTLIKFAGVLFVGIGIFFISLQK